MKKSLSLILAMVMVFTMFASVAFAAETPAPLSTTQKYEALKAKGIFDGFTDGSAGLDKPMTRGQFAKVLATLFKLPQLSSKTFNDTDGHWAAGYAEAVAHSNPVLMEGTWAATFSPEQNVKVEELAAVLVRALNLPIPTTVTVTGADDWAKGYVAAALAANLIPASADYTQPALRGALVDATYTAEVKLAKPTVASATATVNANNTATVAGKVENADSVKVTVGTGTAAAATLNADGTFTFATSALSTGTTNISVVAYKGDVASAAFALTATVTTFGVSKVEVLNNSQIKVTFNGVYDDSASGNGAKSPDRYELGAAKTPPTGIDKADGDTAVILTFAGFTKQDTPNYQQFTVNPVAKKNDPANVKSTLYSTVLDVNEKVAPTITDVTASTNGTAATKVKIKFSEPVRTDVDSVIKVDSTAFTQSQIDAGIWTDNHATVELGGLTLSTSGTHTVEAVKMEDLADNVADYLTKSVSVTTDTTLPAVSSVVASGDSTIIITFSEKVKRSTVQTAIPSGNLRQEDFTTVPTGAVTSDSGDPTDTKFKLPITTTGLFDNNSTRTFNLVIAKGIEDEAGNVTTAASTTTVTFTKDATAPTVTGLSFKTTTDPINGTYVSALVVTFNENVAIKGVGAKVSASKVTVIDSNGVLKNGSSAANGFLQDGDVKDNTVTFPLAASLYTKSGTFQVTVGGGTVTDVSQAKNDNAAYTGSITFGTSGTTTHTITTRPTSANNVITLTFPVDVKGGAVAGSATDVANYTLGGAALPAGTTITLDSDKKVATITLPDSSIASTDPNAVFVVKNVLANDGNAVNQYVNTLRVDDNIKPVLQTAVINGDQITLTYNEDVTTATASDYKITVNGNDFTGSIGQIFKVTNNKKTVVLVVNGGNWNRDLPIVIKTKAYDAINNAGATLKDDPAGNYQKGDITVTATKQS